jgi:hypothetical protein
MNEEIKKMILSTLLAMAYDEQFCESMWNDVIHLDQGSDILIATLLTEQMIQVQTDKAFAEKLIADLNEREEKLKLFSEKFLTK